MQKKKFKWSKKPDSYYAKEYSDAQINDKLICICDSFDGHVSLTSWAYGIDHSVPYPASQITGYKDVRKKFSNIEWWLFIDPDEFLILYEDLSIDQFINRYPNAGSFVFSCRIFNGRSVDKPVMNFEKKPCLTKQPIILQKVYISCLY